MITVILPIRTESEANLRQCWRRSASRAKAQKRDTFFGLHNFKIQIKGHGVYKITLTRIAPRSMDDDNNIRAFKAIRDQIADILEIDDGSNKITWSYAQRKGKPKQYAVEVKIGWA